MGVKIIELSTVNYMYVNLQKRLSKLVVFFYKTYRHPPYACLRIREGTCEPRILLQSRSRAIGLVGRFGMPRLSPRH